MSDRDRWQADGWCTIGKALDVIGTRSAMLLMREAFYGTTRFDEFARRVGVTEAVAAARLKELVEAGLLVRRPYQEPGQRTRQEYLLTVMGRDLMPAALALMQWGNKHLTDDQGGPVELHHADCGAEVTVKVCCANNHEVPLDEITASFRKPIARL